MNQKPPYKPITQLRYHCVPTCLVMILDRHKIKHGTMNDIGYELGLIVPEDLITSFKKARTGKKPVAGFGTQIAKNQFSINNYFKRYKIELKEKYFPPEKINDYQFFITENIKQSNDLIVCFNSKQLFGSGDWGHACLIQGIHKDKIVLIDPGIGAPKIRNVELSDLIDAIIKHGRKNRGGIWVISRNNKNDKKIGSEFVVLPPIS